jgi:YHS domain-containing protein
MSSGLGRLTAIISRRFFFASFHEAAGSQSTRRRTVAIDPVCKMQVDENKAAGTSEYNGKTYYFCAPGCKAKFDQNPKQYVK